MNFKLKIIISLNLILALTISQSGLAEQVRDIKAPFDFSRVEIKQSSFAKYLRNLPISTSKQIKLWDGQFLPENQYQSLGLVDVPLLFDEDLEQCADWTMRFWSDYLKNTNDLKSLALFGFYGKPKPFTKSGKTYRQYLYWHMKYSNSYSILKGAKKINSLTQLEPGDMFVQNHGDEGIGHVSMVLDQAQNVVGKNVYLVGYSFMPAQQFHIEQASDGYGIQGWFTAEGYKAFASQAFGSFGEPIVMRYQKYQN